VKSGTLAVFILLFSNLMLAGQQDSVTQPPPTPQQPSTAPNAPEPPETPEPQGPPEPRSTPRWELFGGYSYVGGDPFSVGTTSPLQGGEVNVTLNAAGWLGFLADFGANYGTVRIPVTTPTPFPPCPPLCPGSVGTFSVNTHLYTYLFGARLPYRKWEKVTPFAELLYGRAHVSGEILGTSEKDTKGTIAGGLGLDYAISQRLAWRVQGDYLRVKFFGVKADNYRLSTGIVLRWTHRKKRRTLTTP
jgi:opacity protein-like surface antigen